MFGRGFCCIMSEFLTILISRRLCQTATGLICLVRFSHGLASQPPQTAAQALIASRRLSKLIIPPTSRLGFVRSALQIERGREREPTWTTATRVCAFND